MFLIFYYFKRPNGMMYMYSRYSINELLYLVFSLRTLIDNKETLK